MSQRRTRAYTPDSGPPQSDARVSDTPADHFPTSDDHPELRPLDQGRPPSRNRERAEVVARERAEVVAEDRSAAQVWMTADGEFMARCGLCDWYDTPYSTDTDAGEVARIHVGDEHFDV